MLEGFILIEPIKEDGITAGGVYTPETSQEKPSKGKVLTFGDKSLSKKCSISDFIKIKDIVIYKRYVNETLNWEGRETLVVKWEDLMAVII